MKKQQYFYNKKNLTIAINNGALDKYELFRNKALNGFITHNKVFMAQDNNKYILNSFFNEQNRQLELFVLNFKNLKPVKIDSINFIAEYIEEFKEILTKEKIIRD